MCVCVRACVCVSREILMYLRILYMRSHLCSHHYKCLRLISPLRKKQLRSNSTSSVSHFL